MNLRNFAMCLVLSCLCANFAFALDKSKDCKCRVSTTKRIVNGRPTTASFPWYVTIRGNDNSKSKSRQTKRLLPDIYKLGLHQCGSVILNENWILTTVNCLLRPDAKDYAIEFGGNDLVHLYDEDMYVEVEKVIPHPDAAGKWPRITLNDISLMRLRKPLNFSSTVQPACLDTVHQEFYGEPLKTIGFGSTNSIRVDVEKDKLTNPQISRYLKEAIVFENTNSSKLCEGMTKQDICVKAAVKTDESQGTPCAGDEASPLMWTKNGLSKVVGLFSQYEVIPKSNVAGTFCEGDSAFMRISSYIDWIKSHDVGEICD